MSGKRVFTKPVGPDAKYKPAIRVEFAGKNQTDYFSLKRIAEEKFGVKQAALCRLILCEWAKDYRGKEAADQTKAAQQMVLILPGTKEIAAKSAAKSRASGKDGKNE